MVQKKFNSPSLNCFQEMSPNFVRLSCFCLLLLFIGRGTCGVTKCAYVHHDVLKEMASQNVDNNRSGDRSSDAMTVSKNSDDDSSSISSTSKTALQGEILPDNRTMQCTKASDFCYALWKESTNNKSTITILAQGCWESSGEYDCRRQTECVADNRPMKAMNNTKFCCCAGDLCNVNMTESDLPLVSEELDSAKPVPTYQQSKHNTDMLIVTLLFAMLLATVMIIAFLWYRRCLANQKPNPDSVHLMESAGHAAQAPTLDLENLKLIELVGRGRYGSVWRGTLNDYEVAIKVFVHQHRQYFLNEKDIYTMPCMEHPSLMKFIGCEQKPALASDATDARPEYYLVMGYAPFGCLHDYLKANVVDWPTLCCMTQGVAKGLAHLHTDLQRGDKIKLCISHRDVNSRNVLVKADLTCALCDMGFAMKIAGSKYYSHSGEEQHAETTSLTDVGTLRYMAPEVLEGAVNLRDCESSLKQIDVYALGLVTWEVATRCSDLYQGLDVPDYKLPFEVEIGLHPTFEQMQVLVSRNKARPLFPEVWKDTNLAVRLLKETIEDCWDQDAEARLTSLCVEERLQELPTLWERHKANIGISPTVNPTFLVSLNHQMDASNGSELTDRNANIMGVVLRTDPVFAAGFFGNRATNMDNSYQHSNTSANTESSISENTVETVVAISPAEPIVVSNAVQHHQQPPQSKNCMSNQAFPWLPMSLQPHQGRNPCLERNMIMDPVEEVSVSGNTLLGKGFNEKTLPLVHRDIGSTGDGDIGDLFDALNLVDNMESNSLVNHDVLSHSNRAYHPIPYLQNAVHDALPAIHCPKQPNVPGNGQHSPQPPALINKPDQHKHGAFTTLFDHKRWIQSPSASTSAGAGGAKLKKERSRIHSLLDWSKFTRSMSSGRDEFKSNASNSKEVLGSSSSTRVATQSAISDVTFNKGKSNLMNERDQQLEVFPDPGIEYQMVQTEVCIGAKDDFGSLDVANEKPVVRLANRNLTNSVASFKSTKLGLSDQHIQNGQPVIKISSGSQTDLNHVSTSSLSNDHTMIKRPTTLNLKRYDLYHPSNSSSHLFESPITPDVNLSEELSLEKPQVTVNELKHGTKQNIQRRIKTPFALKPGRFSLHDDRMMSSWPASGLTTNQNMSKHSHSVPIHINHLNSLDGPSSTADSLTLMEQSGYVKSASAGNCNAEDETCLCTNIPEMSTINDGSSDAAVAIKLMPTPSSISKYNSHATSLPMVNGCIDHKVNGHSPVIFPPSVEPVFIHVSCT